MRPLNRLYRPPHTYRKKPAEECCRVTGPELEAYGVLEVLEGRKFTSKPVPVREREREREEGGREI